MLIIKRAYTKHVGEGDGGFYKLFKKKKKIECIELSISWPSNFSKKNSLPLPSILGFCLRLDCGSILGVVFTVIFNALK